MNISLKQQYEYLNWRRRVSRIYLQRLVESKAAQQNFIAQQIHAYIMAGNDPTKNPDLSGDYFYLIDEYGENFFNDESGSFFIHKEEDK